MYTIIVVVAHTVQYSMLRVATTIEALHRSYPFSTVEPQNLGTAQKWSQAACAPFALFANSLLYLLILDTKTKPHMFLIEFHVFQDHCFHAGFYDLHCMRLYHKIFILYV